MNFEFNEEHLKEKYNDESELPTSIRLDACTLCQLKCPSCYRQTNPEYSKFIGEGYLKFKDFKKLVDENEVIKTIELSNRGEIFLNPELIDIIKYAYEKDIKLTANNGVNLNNLTDEQAEALVKYNFEGMVVLIDGASQETYKIHRVGGNYNNVINNIRKISHFKLKYNKRKPAIVWKFIVFGHNEHEIPKAKEEAKKLGVYRLDFAVNSDKRYSQVKDIEFIKKETGLEHLDINSNCIVRLKEYLNGQTNWFFCKYLWEPQINWNGDVLGCCTKSKKKFSGNIFKDGLLETLNNPQIIYAKNMITNKAISNDNIPCNTCFVYKEMQDSNIWFISPKVLELSEEHLKEKYKDKSELPTSIRLDACTLCQLKCPVCFRQTNPDYKKFIGEGYLKFKDFKKLVDENEVIKTIELSNSGEIFLNPELVDIIKYSYEKSITLTANNGVNLNYLTDAQAEALVKYRFERIVVSIDG
ncbi:SPASM domain-containing protein, partial [bacterium]|nr:SPASM domain-containing protein [bacterium]